MKSLYLMRHAKSDRDATYVGDKNRPLSARGLKDARRMGRILSRQHGIPEIVLCSTAQRTRETLDNLRMSVGWNETEVQYDDSIYLASLAQLLQCIRNLADTHESAMVIGHEPTMSLLSGQIVGGAAIQFPTAAISCIDLNMDQWRSLRPGLGSLRWHIVPRILQKRKKDT